MKTALPDYRVRHSQRSKSIRLKVTWEAGLSVVVPSGFDEKKIPVILKRKRVWIADAMKRAKEARRFLEPKPHTHLPEHAKLAALGEIWTIVYKRDTTHAGLRLRAEKAKLIITGQTLKRDAVIRKLKDWLRIRVRKGLFPLAENLARKHRLKLGGLLVKSQRTRWASCSVKRNLSLNTKLLFLPPDLVRYVLIHELCHTAHMNHSNEFWRLVQSYEQDYKRLDQELRSAWRRVPQWAF
jgi:predicted metal-dependent hydrolase